MMASMRLSTGILFLSLLVPCGTGCDQTPTGPPAPAAPLSWVQIAGGVGEARFVAGWGSHPDSVLALGTSYPMLRMVGGQWSREPLPANTAALRSVWGRAGNDVYAGGENGQILHFDGTSWSKMPSGTSTNIHDVWGIEAPTMFAVGTDIASGAGRVFTYDGAAWTPMVGRFDTGLNTVWAGAARAVFVAGDLGYVAKYDNRGWSALVPFATDYAWLDAWGASTTEVFFVGEGGNAAHYHNGVLTIQTTPVVDILRGVFGFAANDVWAVGDRGVILHFDGTSWSAVQSGTISPLHAVFGFSDGTALALGDNGTVLRMSGGAWQVVRDGRIVTWRAACAASPDDAFFAGLQGSSNGIVRHSDGREWIFPDEEVLGLFGLAADDAYAVGRGGSIRHFDGMDWTRETSGTLVALFAASGVESDAARRLYAVGDRHTIRVWDGTRWGPMIPPGASLAPILDVWASAADDVFAVDSDGGVLRYRGPLTSLQWTREDPGLGASFFNALSGRSPVDVVAVTQDGRIFHYDGTGWKAMVGGNGAPLPDVVLDGRRDGAALSQPHTLLTLHNAQWNAIDIPFLGELRALAMNGDTGFVAGVNGSILEFKR